MLNLQSVKKETEQVCNFDRDEIQSMIDSNEFNCKEVLAVLVALNTQLETWKEGLYDCEGYELDDQAEALLLLSENDFRTAVAKIIAKGVERDNILGKIKEQIEKVFVSDCKEDLTYFSSEVMTDELEDKLSAGISNAGLSALLNKIIKNLSGEDNKTQKAGELKTTKKLGGEKMKNGKTVDVNLLITKDITVGGETIRVNKAYNDAFKSLKKEGFKSKKIKELLISFPKGKKTNCDKKSQINAQWANGAAMFGLSKRAMNSPEVIRTTVTKLGGELLFGDYERVMDLKGKKVWVLNASLNQMNRADMQEMIGVLGEENVKFFNVRSTDDNGKKVITKEIKDDAIKIAKLAGVEVIDFYGSKMEQNFTIGKIGGRNKLWLHAFVANEHGRQMFLKTPTSVLSAKPIGSYLGAEDVETNIDVLARIASKDITAESTKLDFAAVDMEDFSKFTKKLQEVEAFELIKNKLYVQTQHIKYIKGALMVETNALVKIAREFFIMKRYIKDESELVEAFKLLESDYDTFKTNVMEDKYGKGLKRVLFSATEKKQEVVTALEEARRSLHSLLIMHKQKLLTKKANATFLRSESVKYLLALTHNGEEGVAYVNKAHQKKNESSGDSALIVRNPQTGIWGAAVQVVYDDVTPVGTVRMSVADLARLQGDTDGDMVFLHSITANERKIVNDKVGRLAACFVEATDEEMEVSLEGLDFDLSFDNRVNLNAAGVEQARANNECTGMYVNAMTGFVNQLVNNKVATDDIYDVQNNIVKPVAQVPISAKNNKSFANGVVEELKDLMSDFKIKQENVIDILNVVHGLDQDELETL